jgi:hypothetical protein
MLNADIAAAPGRSVACAAGAAVSPWLVPWPAPHTQSPSRVRSMPLQGKCRLRRRGAKRASAYLPASPIQRRARRIKSPSRALGPIVPIDRRVLRVVSRESSEVPS